MIEQNSLILGQDQYYSLDCYKTKLNNNVLVVGASGAGKTRSIVIPNLLQATGSYVISDPKGNLYNQYKSYLRNKGYVVKKLDFTDPKHSAHYNFFKYIRSTLDIVKVAHMMIYQDRDKGRADPFWDRSAQLLLQSLIAYLMEACNEEDRILHNINRLVAACQIEGDMETEKTQLDSLMMEYGKDNPDSYALEMYRMFRTAADRTLRSILISLSAQIGLWDIPELIEMTSDDNVDIHLIGRRKTALFVVVSDTDRSLDGLVNIFLTQTMNELCRIADKECHDYKLPIPVRFILDDFATNCRIDEFPRMISSIRSRGISAMLMVQSEGQLQESYGNDGKTIIGNCDTYVYLGSNDVETAKAVSERCDTPLKKILNMPVGTNWIFRRGQEPVNGKVFDLDSYVRTQKKNDCRGL